MQFEPQKYWNIDPHDIRMRTLKAFAETINSKALETQKTEEIVKFCIDAMQNFRLSPKEELELRDAIFAQNRHMLPSWLKTIRAEIATLESDKISIISLGCGDESVFERAIDEDFAKKSTGIKLEWTGVDVADYRSDSSFMKDKKFKTVDPYSNIFYRSLLETSDPIVLVGRWTYHHLGISFSDFLERCRGLSKVILVEEPTEIRLWNLPDYRVMRIAYDVLGNFIISHSWAKEFMDNPAKFKIKYLFREDVPSGVKIIDLEDMLPENSLVIANLEK
jgi:hypothetical protein